MIDLVENSWLEKRLGDPSVRIVDPRPRVKYLQGHIPGAVNLSLSEIFDRDTLALYPDEKLAGIFGTAGIDSDSTVVLYDSYDGQNAAMLAWLLEYLGQPHVSLLSSYLEVWAKHGGKLLYRPVQNDPKDFLWKPRQTSRATLEHLVERGKTKLLDLRGPPEYQGKVDSESRSGHIPGAINLAWTELLGDDGSFLRSETELRLIFSDIGLIPADEIVTYCTNGPRAALGYIALQRSDFKNARVYDGSFHQWASRADLPIEQSDADPALKPRPLGSVASPCIVDSIPGLTRN